MEWAQRMRMSGYYGAQLTLGLQALSLNKYLIAYTFDFK